MLVSVSSDACCQITLALVISIMISCALVDRVANYVLLLYVSCVSVLLCVCNDFFSRSCEQILMKFCREVGLARGEIS